MARRVQASAPFGPFSLVRFQTCVRDHGWRGTKAVLILATEAQKRRRDPRTDEEGPLAKQDYEEKYTDPELREKIKEEIKASDKGGKVGQWSARKSQLLTQEYEKRGGGYKAEKGQSQKNLEKWTEDEWQTKEGEADARQDDGETKRYLPKKAWENMSEEEKEETEQKKREGSKKGQQYVSNTEEAKKARKNAKDVPINGYDELSVGEVEKKIKGLSKDEIKAVRSYEKNNKNRKTLLEKIDSKL
jgi:hypothetical protein